MRFFNCLIFSFLFLANAKAQHNHFVYIQTENKQAFYVRLNEKIFSSAASGYLVIPKLTDGPYKLNIGFPKNEWPSQNFDITINNKDEGFVLKNFDAKGWGLFNIQTLDLVMGTMADTGNSPAINNKTDAFSNTLAEVTNTPSIKQQDLSSDTLKRVLKEETKREDTAISITAKRIEKTFSILDSSGRSIIYMIADGNNMDTVRLFIPYDKNESKALIKDIETSRNAEMKENKDTLSITSVDAAIKKDSAIIATKEVHDQAQKDGRDTTIITTAKGVNKNEYKITIINTDCKAAATEKDFVKLQKKMTSAANDEDKITIAKKIFRSMCFTSSQVKELSLIFSNDEEKYNFYDAAYRYVSDIGNFKDLQSQLSDEYYINRFKAMLR